jgi:four helix bundle protein
VTFPHHSLVAWQRADELFIKVHGLARIRFPSSERFALTSQTRRAALSIPLNIVEGYSRRNPRERLQFLRTAWASLAELDYCLYVARRLEYLSEHEYQDIDAELRRTAAPLQGLLNHVKQRAV